MKKFDELMSVSNEITNISVDEAREKLKDPMFNLLMLGTKVVLTQRL